jgi:hypothetical protein
MIRANYLVENPPLWFSDLTLEGFFNPGDIYPNFYGAPGAPFQIAPNFPPNMVLTERDRRGKNEYGIRLGAMISAFYFTLNYLYVYNDEVSLNFTGWTFGPAGAIMQANFEYPSTDIYGFSCNYAIGGKINTVITTEAKWVPNQPYGDAKEVLPAIKDQGTFSYSIKFDRQTFLLPRPTSAAMVSFQVAQVLLEGDEDRIAGPGNVAVDKTQTIIGGMVMQNLWYNNITLSFQPMWDTDGAYMLKPAFKYVYGDYWYFDVYAIFVGGSEKRPGRFGSLKWADEVVFRVTLQF